MWAHLMAARLLADPMVGATTASVRLVKFALITTSVIKVFTMYGLITVGNLFSVH